MIDCRVFHEAIVAHGISFFTGVPDSVLKYFCAHLSEYTASKNHIIAANEGNAVALAAGHYLATGVPGLVYMQNSGLGNAINPLTSLVDPRVFKIPMLLLVGWRGEPGTRDEPQHMRQGEVTLPLLDTLGIHREVLDDDPRSALEILGATATRLTADPRPVALVVRKGTFEPYEARAPTGPGYAMRREEVVGSVADSIGPEAAVVATTGKISRELFEHCFSEGDRETDREFLMVGSMGHASQIAMGIALARPDRDVYCLDGDGAVIMHMGSLALIGAQRVSNLKHIVINNGAHDSVGGQPSVGFSIDLAAIARACGYAETFVAESPDELTAGLDKLTNCPGPALLEVRVATGARKELGRPTRTPLENKDRFMSFLRQ